MRLKDMTLSGQCCIIFVITFCVIFTIETFLDYFDVGEISFWERFRTGATVGIGMAGYLYWAAKQRLAGEGDPTGEKAA
jgi:hypothetical protein